MTATATAQPCGCQYTWAEPDGAEPRWYLVPFAFYHMPRCQHCGEGVCALDVRVSKVAA